MMQQNTGEDNQSQAPASSSFTLLSLQTNHSHAGLPILPQGETQNQPAIQMPQLQSGSYNYFCSAGTLANFQPEYPTSVLPKADNGAQGTQEPPLDDLQKLRLLKNREAVRKYWQRKKAMMEWYEKRMVSLEQQNMALKAELRLLKSLFHHKVESLQTK